MGNKVVQIWMGKRLAAEMTEQEYEDFRYASLSYLTGSGNLDDVKESIKGVKKK